MKDEETKVKESKKKWNRKLRWYEMIFFIILIALIVFILNFDRKALILKKLQSKRKF